ncbi:MAG: hypothetical protein A2259_01005 [Candidatus Moranbacteria bacterium RIFOXYA2_FULL_43_15]|nr:MAG: hypothetical protein A2259_01005 [Candidatus Moranbacteria bacterium RIFOXYA2_FULL_43_15]
MNQSNPQAPNKNVNFFLVPHIPFDDQKLRHALTHAERDFFMVLCHLSNRYADKDGWFFVLEKCKIIISTQQRSLT